MSHNILWDEGEKVVYYWKKNYWFFEKYIYPLEFTFWHIYLTKRIKRREGLGAHEKAGRNCRKKYNANFRNYSERLK